MATDMKFGPQWLRALSSDGNPNPNTSSASTTATATTGTPKYKLAEYRYGREEMLALFNHNLKPPEDLAQFPHLFVEKMQLPLAFTNMTEEESRLWSRVNSDVVLRLAGKGGSGAERGDRAMNERGGVNMRAGRGGMSDRGRGRGRGYYQRNNYEDNGESPPDRRDFRNRTPFERNHSLNDETRDKKYDRSFSRGGIGGPDDRKNNSRSSSVENWRTGGRGEDREGWRTARGPNENWNRSNSWRSGERDKDYEQDEHSERNGPHRKYNNYQKDRNPNDLWDDIDENDRRNSLPEWSLDDGPESDAKVGTFDASGAFREDTIDDEDTKPEDELTESKNISGMSEQNSKSNQSMKSLNDLRNESKNEKLKQNIEKSLKSEDNNKGMAVSTHKLSKQQLQQKSSQQPISQSSSQMPSNTSNKLLNNKQNDSLNCNSNPNSHNIKSLPEEDGFAHLEKEAEHMVAQWTADDDQKDKPDGRNQTPDEQKNSGVVVLPAQHDDAFKWFYRDPQNEIQGPFTPHEMYDWFTAGYFAMDLLVRRGCDEYFIQLGELFKVWERIPFLVIQGSNPPPLRLQSPNPSLPSHPSSSAPHHPIHTMAATPPQHILHQQLASQPTPHPSQPQQPIFTNQQSVEMQSQLRQLLAQLKKTEGFADLSQQQQQEVLVQRYVHLEQQRHQSLQTSIPNTRSAEESQMNPLDALSNLRLQSTRPLPVVNNTSIWDMNSGALSVSAIEEMQRKEQELKELEERRKAFEDEQNRKKMEQQLKEMKEQDELRKMNEEREKRYQELQKKLEEERVRNQELLRKQEDEKRRREDEERVRLEEEERRAQERASEEQKRRHDELMRLEEYARRQALQEEERRRQIEIEKDRQRLHLQEIERERVKEMERLRHLQQQEAILKLQQQQEKQRKGWSTGGSEHNQKQPQSSLSLDDIQRLQEEDREERERQRQLQQKHMQALFAAQQQQQNKQSLTWAAPTYQQQSAPVKTLAEIQREEAEKMAKQRSIDNKKQQTQVTNTVPNAGIWNNANNQLFGQTAPTKANSAATNNTVSIGFWEPESRKVATNRAPNESALHSMQPNSKGNNNNNNNNSTHFHTKPNLRNKKEEETVLRLFENQRRQKTDEFTQWCNEALSEYQSSVDIPTFIAFLKDVESPFEITDYVRSYLGDTKDVKEFAKQFIERRSYFRNQAKREATENQELMWGPAPAITPSVNKAQPTVQTSSANSIVADSGFIQAGKKKKKGKRVIDNSILGFTVQADPDRINAGEIEQIDD